VAASQHCGRIHTSQISVSYHVAQEPFGARRWCLCVSPCSGWAARAAARLLAAPALSTVAWGDTLCSSSSSAAAYTNFFKQIFLLKHMEENILCLRCIAATQTRCLVSLDLSCSYGCWAVTLTGIYIYILKEIHIYFFSLGRCYVNIISFISAGARVVYSVRHSSCSVLPD